MAIANKIGKEFFRFLKKIFPPSSSQYKIFYRNWFLLDDISNGQFLSLQYMDDRSWNWGTVRWRWAYGTQMTWILALCVLLNTSRKGNLLSCSFFIVNCIDGRIEFTWSSNIWTSSWWGQRMNVSSMYPSHIDGFSDVDPNVISSKYPMYKFANTGDNGEPIASPSCRYISDPIPVVSTQKVSISIRLSIGIQVRSSSRGSAASLFRTTASVSLVGAFVNRLTTSKLTIWFRMNRGITDFLHKAEFLTYDEDLPVSGLMISTRKRLNGWHAEPRLLTMGLKSVNLSV